LRDAEVIEPDNTQMESRLDLLSPNLANELSRVNEQKLRKVAYSVCDFALRHVSINNPLVNQSFEAFKGSASIDILSLRRNLSGLIEQLDEIQWDIQEQVDLGLDTRENYVKAFRNARAINALFYAFDPNPYIAAAESIYEAYAATYDFKSLEEAINEILIE